MPLSPAAENELRSILRSYHAAYAGMAVPTGAGKALEAFIFFKLAQAAGGSTPRSWRVSLHRGDGTALPAGGAFNLPGGPSRIQSSSVSAPCYALIRNIPNPTLSFELHGSVQWIGRSQTKHEVDISVLPSTIGEKIRNNGGGYPQGLPIAAIECKDKLGKGDLDEARQTLARMFDLAPVTTPPAIAACRVFETNTSSHWGKKSSKYRSFFNKCHIGVVRASGFSRGVGTLFTHYYLKGYSDIYTSSGSMMKLEADFRENISHAVNY